MANAVCKFQVSSSVQGFFIEGVGWGVNTKPSLSAPEESLCLQHLRGVRRKAKFVSTQREKKHAQHPHKRLIHGTCSRLPRGSGLVTSAVKAKF